MVAVPAVLGIASIRVYTVSEAPTDGLVTREKVMARMKPPGDLLRDCLVPVTELLHITTC